MTTLLFLALLNKADDVESVREISLLATREKIEATVTNFGLPALKVLLEDTESAAGTLGIAEVKVGKNLAKSSFVSKVDSKQNRTMATLGL